MLLVAYLRRGASAPRRCTAPTARLLAPMVRRSDNVDRDAGPRRRRRRGLQRVAAPRGMPRFRAAPGLGPEHASTRAT